MGSSGPAAILATVWDSLGQKCGTAWVKSVGQPGSKVWDSLGQKAPPSSKRSGIVFLPTARADPRPQGNRSQEHLMQLSWSTLISRCAAQPQALALPVSYGRSLWIPLTARTHSSSEHVVKGTHDATLGPPVSSTAAFSSPGPEGGSKGDPTRLAFFNFHQLCGNEGLGEPGSPIRSTLGPSDYLSICRWAQPLRCC